MKLPTEITKIVARYVGYDLRLHVGLDTLISGIGKISADWNTIVGAPYLSNYSYGLVVQLFRYPPPYPVGDARATNEVLKRNMTIEVEKYLTSII